jgi:hypothetical protein
MEPERRQANAYLISLWVDRSDSVRPVSRGALVTAAEQRLYFSTLAELNRWLCEMAGWQDPPPGTNRPGENVTST